MATNTERQKTDYFEETFFSPFFKDTEADALKVLDAIRTAHPASAGWVEINGYVEKINGKWRAVRVHKKNKIIQY